MTQTYFITGTDTGVGKTAFCVGLLSALRAAGRTVAALKPAETGCLPDGPRDAARLRDASGLDLSLDIICPNQFDLPLAPAIAARHAGRSFTTPMSIYNRLLKTNPDVFVIEGAGGWLVPYADNITTGDLVRSFSATVVVVGRAGLGTINHTALTVAAIRNEQLPIKGVILNHTEPTCDPSVTDNAEAIESMSDIKVLATIPFVAPETSESLGRAVAGVLDLDDW